MSPNINVVETALKTITSAQLTPTEHLLLKDFVQSAVDPSRAAQHVLQRIRNDPSGKSVEGALRDLKADWRRLTAECESPLQFLSDAYMVEVLLSTSNPCRQSTGQVADSCSMS
jgi:hypothetical protein